MTPIVRTLSDVTGLSQSMVLTIMESAPVRYKEFTIPKRNGGVRLIAQPAREVKLLQRALVSKLLISLPIHPGATAYRPMLSIRHNALPHVGTGPILKLDFKDFFPSIRAQDWIAYCRSSNCIHNERDIHLTASLMFRRYAGLRELRLAVGAPSSPLLSNILMYGFDSIITNELLDDRVRYTRYADDLTFSAPRAGFLNRVLKVVNQTLRSLRHPRLVLNAEKTRYATSKYGRKVTGLVLTNDGMVSIGREKKRALHAAVHKATISPINRSEIVKLAGYLAFVNSVEPEFISVLRRKYGDGIISYIYGHVRVG